MGQIELFQRFANCLVLSHISHCRLTKHLSDISAKKQHIMIKHNKDTDKLKSPDIRKILNNKSKIIYKNNNKNRSQILEVQTIKKIMKHYK